jgi:MICOS complex subunit MIC60
MIYLTLLSGLGYAGAVYYAMVSDNFHDFFTEYVPFGEDIVGYFEEQEFRRRFPGNTQNTRLHPQVRGEEKVKISSKSGMASRRVEEARASDLSSTGRHMSAVEDNKPKPKEQSTSPAPPVEKPKEKRADTKTENLQDSHTHNLLPKTQSTSAPIVKSEPQKSEPAKVAPPPAEEKPSAPAPLIDNISIQEGEEPVVQDVVKILNDIITVVNADGAAGKYSSAISKAKGDLSKVINDLTILKESEKKATDDKIKSLHTEFDSAAKELVHRLEREMHDQETKFKEEFESEREKLSNTYSQKLESELETARKVHEQKLKNQLLEQSISLQRKFTESIRDRVETERSGRLSRLSQLSDTVEDLEKLTGEWTSVVDANLKTQHLMVAVEAVRATLEQADRPRPFTEELVALKEVAADDPIVNAAIASINPIAYQRGIPTASQLIDRFRRVATEVRKASLLPENAGLASHLASMTLSKIMFKKQGLPVGDDVESVLTRTEVLLEEGELDAATREMNGLTGWAKILARDWLNDCRRVLEVKQALDVSIVGTTH